MTLLSWIKGLFAPLHTADHASLGKTIAVSRLPTSRYYWETWEEIEFRGFSILLVFEAGSSGPTDDQAQMWDHIKDHFERYLETSQNEVRPIWEKTNGNFPLTDFRPCLVELPNEGDSSRSWKLRLDHEEAGRGYVVQFTGETPVGVEAD